MAVQTIVTDHRLCPVKHHGLFPRPVILQWHEIVDDPEMIGEGGVSPGIHGVGKVEGSLLTQIGGRLVEWGECAALSELEDGGRRQRWEDVRRSRHLRRLSSIGGKRCIELSYSA